MRDTSCGCTNVISLSPLLAVIMEGEHGGDMEKIFPRIDRSSFLLGLGLLIGCIPGLAQTTTGSLPTVAISYPASGATVSGQTYITLNTHFNLPLAGSETQKVYLDGNLLWTNSGINFVQAILWNTTTTAAGTHTITSLVTDALGNSATSNPITVTVQNTVGGADTTPPTSPGNLSATATCDKVLLSWTPATDLNGSGVQAYTIHRNGYQGITIAADRNWFSDTDNVQSGTTYSYYLVAVDFANNRSAASNTITVTTPACPVVSSEEVFDSADREPSGRAIANYGSLEAIVYQKLNPSTARYDSYVQLKDESSGASSHFLLHADEYETDYILPNATTLWALVQTAGSGLFVNQYQLNGSPLPTSATLVSSQPFGDANSCAKSLFQLKSGAVIAAWTSECAVWGSSSYIQLSLAYWNLSGNFWAAPFTYALGTDNWKERIAIAQHPADGSIWVFNLEDTGMKIGASHFTELPSGLSLDWTNPWYIAANNSSGTIQDGANGPADEYPYLVAVADPARNTIDLAYQRMSNAYIYVDPLFQNGSNGIFLKEDPISVAEINSDGTKSFDDSLAYTARTAYFGFSVLGNGTMWLAYFPIDEQSLNWNRVHTTEYTNGVWTSPALVGYNMNGIYDWDLSGPQYDPGFIIYRPDQPQVAFRSADSRIHSYNLDGSLVVPAPAGPTAPTNLVSSNITSSSVVLSWTASTGTLGVAGYYVYRCQGTGCNPAMIGTTSNTSVQDTGLASGTSYTYAVAAYDASHNVSALSAPFSATTAVIAPTVTITNPSNGANLKTASATISSSASDVTGVVKMQLYIDGSLKAQTASSSLSYKWNTNKIAAGSHTITSKAYDAVGNTGAMSITVYK